MVEEERKVLKDVGMTPKAKVVEDLVHYDLDEPSLDYFFLTNSNLREQERIEFIKFLIANIDAFTWTPYEMPRIDLSFIKHELNVIPEAYPMKQRGRRSATEFVDALIEDVEKLKKASVIMEFLTLIGYPKQLW